MRELLFVVRTFVLTIAIVMVLQIQMGDRTIENHAIQFVQSSRISAPLNMTVKGAAKMMRDLSHYVRRKISGLSWTR